MKAIQKTREKLLGKFRAHMKEAPGLEKSKRKLKSNYQRSQNGTRESTKTEQCAQEY